MTEIEVKIESDWRVTIPKKLRNKSNFTIGDRVILKTKNKTTAEKISPERERDEFVKYMFETNTFTGADVLLLGKMYLKSCVNASLAISKQEFSEQELEELKNLKEHPSQLIEEVDGKYYLSDAGILAALGYIKGLLHAKKIGLL
ncbi:MAG: hypothetical protein ACE5KT_10530 [Methanosarcinales archaeon]